MWRMRLNQRILIIIFNYRKWFCVCFNLHSTLAILVVSPFSLLFSVSFVSSVFFVSRASAFQLVSLSVQLPVIRGRSQLRHMVLV